MEARVWTALTDAPIDVAALERRLADPGNGALVSFTGLVRDHNDGRQVLRLDYDAYRPMAERELRRVAEETSRRFPVTGLILVHRLGSLAIGDVAVAVLAAAAHRDEAFAACREALEAIKRDVPIWKREHHPDGARWVDARALDDDRGPAQDGDGHDLRMVDVADRPTSDRVAVAEAIVRFSTRRTLCDLGRRSHKGDVVTTAQLAGILGAKRTPELIPLCHPLPLTHVHVAIATDEAVPGFRITAEARCHARTGVEMEALTACSVAALTIVDMLKAVDPWMSVDCLRLVSKRGGRHGDLRRPSLSPPR